MDRQFLLDLKTNPSLTKGVEIIYLYSLVDESINYPVMEGKILYIGEACREKSPTGERFQHIAHSSKKGNNYVSNYTLTQYFYKGSKIKLEIFKVPPGMDRKNYEKELLKEHLKRYGAKPIAQGATGENSTPKAVNQDREYDLKRFFLREEKDVYTG